MSQVAKLHIRGSLVNATARSLTPAQKLEAEQAAREAFTDHGVDEFCTKMANEAVANAATIGKVLNNPAAYHRKVYKETFKNTSLGAARTEFCAALGRTIGSEYKDVETALIEVQISFWMTSVDILFHRPKKTIIKMLNSTCTTCRTPCMENEKPLKHCPTCNGTERLKSPKGLILLSTTEVEQLYTATTGQPAPARDRSIIKNPIQRKKFFQTCLFNYLRQILRENTYPKTTTITVMKDYADRVTLQMVKSELGKSDTCSKYTVTNDIAARKITVKFKYTDKEDYNVGDDPLSYETIEALDDIKKFADANGLLMERTDTGITITCVAINVPVISSSVLEKTRLHQISLDGPRNDDSDTGSFREHIESQQDDDRTVKAFSHHDVDLRDCAKVVHDRLNENAQKIFNIITNPPEDYVKRFGDRACKAHVAEYLGLSPKEVQRQWDNIGLQMRAVDLVPQ